jgi:hypothetical protein
VIFSHIFLLLREFNLVSVVELGIMTFSIILCALAVTAYKENHVKKIGFAAVAFGLFALQLFIEWADEAFDLFNEEISDLVLTFITLAILLFFFLAIIKKRKVIDETHFE